MKDTDYADLKAIAERLIVVVKLDADPANWEAAGVKPADMTAKQRGDAHWCRKVASQSLIVLDKVHALIGGMEEATRQGKPAESSGDDGSKQLNKEISQARREATRILKLVPSGNAS